LSGTKDDDFFAAAVVSLHLFPFIHLCTSYNITHEHSVPFAMNNLRSILKTSSRRFGKICLGFGAASIVQGSYFITRYRYNHGEAPHPISPSRGIVSSDKWHASYKSNGSENENELPPLQILVVGDSLACGCGIAKSSTPILPESIARHLATQLDCPVHWSCVGAPGASTKGIMKILQKWFSCKESADDKSYDVVVVLAGMNDMKDVFLPFLAYEKVDLSFSDGLKKIFDVLNQKLRLQRSISHRDSDEPALNREIETPNSTRSLMVLPALPTHAIPLFNYPPIGFFLSTIISYIDSAKQQLSKEHPKNIIFVEAPSPTQIQQFEKGTSNLCSDQKLESALISFHDVKADVKRRVEKLMHDHTSYFERDPDSEAEVECEQAWYSHLRPHIPALGSSLVSYDSIHPNEKGYHYWGGHIAAAIVEEWNVGRERREDRVDDCAV
jgi:lysophospholipase L1-like esterase